MGDFWQRAKQCSNCCYIWLNKSERFKDQLTGYDMISKKAVSCAGVSNWRGEKVMAQSWFFNLQRVRASSVRPFWKSDTVAFSMSALGNRFQIRISPKIDLSISLWCVPKRLSTSWHLCLFCWRRVGTPVVMTSRGNNPLRSLCAFPRTHRNISPSIPMSLRKQSGAILAQAA